MSRLATLTSGKACCRVGAGRQGKCGRRESRLANRCVVMQVTCARISGHRPRPVGRRTIPSTTAQQRREARSCDFCLSGLANERSFDSRAVRMQVLAGASTRQEKPGPLSSTPCRFPPTVLYPARSCPDQASRFGSSKLWEVNSPIDSRAPGQFLQDLLTRTAEPVPGPEYPD